MGKNNSIFIVGHSGAGKGVLAEVVAKKLGWLYVDDDFSLAPSIGRSVLDILGAEGEASFADCLTKILQHQAAQENIVVTTDDSIICAKKNREILSKVFTVFVRVSTSVQIERIGYNRPLLPVKDYAAFLDQLRNDRDDLYEQVASFSLSSDDGKIDEHASMIVEAFGKAK